jgi:hypothetical protein
MKLRLSVDGLPSELREYAGWRIRFRLGRFAARLKSLSVRLTAVHGPGGELRNCCHIRIEAGLDRPVVISECRAGVREAIAFATERAERALRRQLNFAGPGAFTPAERRSAARRPKAW